MCKVIKIFECRRQRPFMSFSLMMIEVLVKLIDRIVSQMRKGICQVVSFGLFEFSIIQKITLSGKPRNSLIVQENSQWLYGRNQDINSHVKF
jgi:hypothetical protein